MIHGHDAVEAAIVARAEETVGREGSESEYTLLAGLLYAGDYHILLLVAEQTAVAGMRIEREHSDARTLESEVAAQRLVERTDGFGHRLAGDGLCHFRNGEMGAHESHTDVIVEKNHAGLVALAGD